MIISQCGVNMSNAWYHDPSLKDNRGLTVAMSYISINDGMFGYYQLKEWEHDPAIRNDKG